ncbi:hypothetical protein SDRG_00318 [Saprolegnia diclina VS20]|uniref:AB hydrolase-1 domain-containing protein n=1 Tax=Saprolegnia diclina (strain VS20) TaxID=1156394 RepID=T0QWI8_SAPDV|nr:hypothetical protein SDRG_00318 [Saprolegnia diclina VS20]EQC42589.1 hypothetical protein SDRG_00318 [Saprolegnia diclina VS20]|eukprot:XP_008604012.1 hypothetical protein SDRG_00318 [Saprolegnia diclina VS20]
MLCRLFIAAIATSVAVASVSPQWVDCPVFSAGQNTTFTMDGITIRAECADVQVPVCYLGVCNSTATMSVFLKRYPASAPTSPAKSAWLLQGGPGIPSNAMEDYMTLLYAAANGSTSFYTMDHRGVGRSSALVEQCKADATLKLNGTNETSNQWLSDCFAVLKAKYGALSYAFSVTSAATDLATIIESPFLADDDVYVYGISYGTYLVERLMHLAPKHVKGYILDGIVSESPVTALSDRNKDIATVETKLYDLCDQDPLCASKIGPNAKQFTFDLFKKLDANDTECAQKVYAAKGRPSDFLGPLFSSLAQGYYGINLIPAIVYRLSKCVTEYTSESAFLDRLLTDRSEDSDGDDIVYYNIVSTELTKLPLPNVTSLVQDALATTWRGSTNDSPAAVSMYCLFTGNSDKELCRDAPPFKNSFFYTRDQYWDKTAAVPAGASVLMLSGGLDAQTIPKYAKQEFASMAGANKLLVDFAYGGHGSIHTTPTDLTDLSKHCGQQVVSMYLQLNGDLQKLDTSCVKNVLPPQFSNILVPFVGEQYFGNSTDMYGDEAPTPVPSVVATVDKPRAVPVAVQSAVATVDANFKIEMVAMVSVMVACVLAVMGMALYVKKLQRATTTAAANAGIDDAVVDEKAPEAAKSEVV